MTAARADGAATQRLIHLSETTPAPHSFIIVEVKSLTPTNEERQLRLGLGHVLSYVHILDWPQAADLRAVLAVERKPTADCWTTLCAEHDVILTWPGAFDNLFPEPF